MTLDKERSLPGAVGRLEPGASARPIDTTSTRIADDSVTDTHESIHNTRKACLLWFRAGINVCIEPDDILILSDCSGDDEASQSTIWVVALITRETEIAFKTSLTSERLFRTFVRICRREVPVLSENVQLRRSCTVQACTMLAPSKLAYQSSIWGTCANTMS